jgi:hypothetical protein
MPHRLRNGILALTLGLVVASTAGAANRSVVVERARTRIGIARVVLNMAPLTLTDAGLVGDYSLSIPLAPFMGDSGTVEIPLTESTNETFAPGNTLRGTATSREDGRVHDVACTFKKSSKVRIVVTTPERVLSFEAPYALTH